MPTTAADFEVGDALMDEDISAMARGSYGYGHWDAPYWFIGLEQGTGSHENGNLELRARAWRDLGRLELNDCREFHRSIHEPRWHFKKPVNLQPTWRPLMLLLMTFLGKQSDSVALRNYQRDSWGALNGETCVIELSGLAAHSLEESREDGRFLEERIEVIRDRLRSSHQRKLVVMYGRKQKDSWEKVAGAEFPHEPEPFLRDGLTTLVFAPHPVSRIRKGSRYLGNEYWTRLGIRLRD